MTTHLKAQRATIRTLDTNFLNINQKVTAAKWNPSKKHPDIFLLNTTETAKLVNGKSGEKAVLGNVPYVPGTTIDTVKYCIHQGSVIHVGIATAARDLTTLAPSTNLASMKFEVTHDTTLTMSLSRTLVSSGPDVYSSKLMFVYKGITTYLDVTGYTGQIMFPWLSDDTNGTGFSVSLARVTVMRTFVRENGDVVFTTIDEGGVSRPIVFETGSSATIFDNLGFSGLPSIKFDILESATTAVNNISSFNMQLRVQHTSAPGLNNPAVLISEAAMLTAPGGLAAPEVLAMVSPLSLGVGSGALVTVDTAGEIVTPASVNTLSVKTTLVQPDVFGTPLRLFEKSGRGITVDDMTGNVSLSHTLTVGSAGTITNGSVLASFGDTGLNKAFVIPTVQNVLITTIPAANWVVGMIVYSIDDDKFMGYKPSGWTDLSV